MQVWGEQKKGKALWLIGGGTRLVMDDRKGPWATKEPLV
jgi:hypothetical protein